MPSATPHGIVVAGSDTEPLREQRRQPGAATMRLQIPRRGLQRRAGERIAADADSERGVDLLPATRSRARRLAGAAPARADRARWRASLRSRTAARTAATRRSPVCPSSSCRTTTSDRRSRMTPPEMMNGSSSGSVSSYSSARVIRIGSRSDVEKPQLAVPPRDHAGGFQVQHAGDQAVAADRR